MPAGTALWGQCTGQEGGPHLCHPSRAALWVGYCERKRRRYQWGECLSVPLISLDLWQFLCGPPRTGWELEFDSLWVAGSVEAAAAAAATPLAGSADIAGNAGAGTLGKGPSEPGIKLGCRGKGSPCHTWAADILLEERRVSEGRNMGRSQA